MKKLNYNQRKIKIMKKFTLFTILIAIAISISAQQQAQKPASLKLNSATDTLQYTLGAYLGQFIVNNGFTVSNPDLFFKGINDVLQKKQLLVNADSIPKRMNEYQVRLISDRNVREEKQLFDNIKGKPGIGILPNGVCYVILKVGTGQRPLATDTVKLQVKGYLADGRLFEDTYAKNTPYKVTPAGLIAGMSEAVQIMPEGSTWRLYIPSALAFASKGVPGLVTPNAAVIFEVELVNIKK
jgi:FKBP-type peptidyl-prolyl cis-trans isomerase